MQHGAGSLPATLAIEGCSSGATAGPTATALLLAFIMPVLTVILREITAVHSATKPATLSVLYSTSAIATGRLLDERVHTSDGTLDFVLAKPKELGGGIGSGTNPEQLLAAAYAASLHAALQAVCSRDGPAFPADASVQGTVGFGLRPDGGFGLEFTLGVKLPGFGPAAAEALLEKAAHICSVCDATRKEVLRLRLL